MRLLKPHHSRQALVFPRGLPDAAVATMLQVCGKFVLDAEDDEQCAEHLQQCSARHERVAARHASANIEVQLLPSRLAHAPELRV
jgi:hypothetical protein